MNYRRIGFGVVVALMGACVDGTIGGVGDADAATDGGAGAVDEALGISAGSLFTCVRRASGAVACWGWNERGYVGDGTTVDRHAPVGLIGLSGVADISSGASHSCARRSSGAVVCWGDNSAGQLGDGTTIERHAPVGVNGLSDAVEVAAGGGHTCARRASGGVVCWGSNSRGQLGNGEGGDIRASSTAPVPVAGLTDALEISAGGDSTCARRTSGAVVCWGDNLTGQIGDRNATLTQRLTPVAVQGLTDAIEIAVGGTHSCARRLSGAVVCWGSNLYGEIGDGSSVVRVRYAPVAVTGISDAVEISMAVTHSCARRTSGQVVCWGRLNPNVIGDAGAGAHSIVPEAVAGLTDAVEITAGGSHNCARRTSNAVVCWGLNDVGQLGDGSTMFRPAPVAVTGL